MSQFADILIDSLPAHLDKQVYTYSIPTSLQGQVRIGSSVSVPFGSQVRRGFVVQLHQQSPGIQTRDILEILSQHLFDERYLAWLQWMADYYCTSFHQVLTTVVPSGLLGRLRERVRPLLDPPQFLQAVAQHFAQTPAVQVLADYLVSSAPVWKSVAGCRQRFGKSAVPCLKLLRQSQLVEIEVVAEAPPSRKKEQLFATLLGAGDTLTPRQQEVLSRLRAEGGYMMVRQLCQQAKTTPGLLRHLEAAGAISIGAGRVMRTPLASREQLAQPVTLNIWQQEALAQIRQHMAEGPPPGGEPAILLHGVTGSGKTEVYIRTVQAVLAQGQSAMILVPEIALTPMMLERFRAHFHEQVAILHSHLSDGERLDEWQKIQAGLARIVIGARSAIFAPLPQLRLIILDEEHESSFKQDNQLRYDARTLALQRMKLEGGWVIFGSATPRLEAFHLARTGTYQYLSLPQRVAQRPLPPITLIDMRRESALGNRGIFSNLLLQRMGQALERAEQVILFLNRRGFASCLLCRVCGGAARCPDCAVSLTYHQAENGLKCHYCSYISPLITRCSACGSEAIRPFGLGTQKVEAISQKLFPAARILRMDRDTTTQKEAHSQFLKQFETGQADILIGTQMVAKGLDFPNVTLVGILAADMALNLPDFRAAERTFQLLTQAAGRAGRGAKAGEIVVQAYAPDHPAIQQAIAYDFESFCASELALREALHYPPFQELVKLTFFHSHEARALGVAREYAQDLAAEEHPIQIMGPMPAPIARIQNLFRVHLFLKCPDAAAIKPSLQRLNRVFYPRLHRLILDIDPYSML